jgi:hypothetical protein
VVSFTPQPLLPLGNTYQYMLDWRSCGPPGRPRGYEETRMELRFLGPLARGLVTILTELIVLKVHSSSGAPHNF